MRTRNKEELQKLWHYVGEKFYKDIPNLGPIWNKMCVKHGFRRDDHPNTILIKYFDSLSDSCQQILYAIEELKYYTTQEASNVYEFYVSHYLYDLLSRIKTSTDILALIINHIFSLEICDNQCSLERGPLSKKLLKKNPNNKVGPIIDKARNDWVGAFYEFRNIVIHKAGLRYNISGISDKSESRILFAAGNLLRITSEKNAINNFLEKIGNTHIDGFCGLIDPLTLSNNLWLELSQLINTLLNECYCKMEEFINNL